MDRAPLTHPSREPPMTTAVRLVRPITDADASTVRIVDRFSTALAHATRGPLAPRIVAALCIVAGITPAGLDGAMTAETFNDWQSLSRAVVTLGRFEAWLIAVQTAARYGLTLTATGENPTSAHLVAMVNAEHRARAAMPRWMFGAVLAVATPEWVSAPGEDDAVLSAGTVAMFPEWALNDATTGRRVVSRAMAVAQAALAMYRARLRHPAG